MSRAISSSSHSDSDEENMAKAKEDKAVGEMKGLGDAVKVCCLLVSGVEWRCQAIYTA
jgi:hypothetical protein